MIEVTHVFRLWSLFQSPIDDVWIAWVVAFEK